MMKPTLSRALAMMTGLVCAPAFADAAGPTEGVVDAKFTVVAHEVLKIPGLGDTTSIVMESDLVLSDNKGGLLDKLGGHCAGFGPNNTKTFAYEMAGSCAFQDESGDKVFEDWKEGSNGADPAQGKGKITGGTGKFAGLTGELTYTTVFYASTREGVYHLNGEKKGWWRRAATQ